VFLRLCFFDASINKPSLCDHRLFSQPGFKLLGGVSICLSIYCKKKKLSPPGRWESGKARVFFSGSFSRLLRCTALTEMLKVLIYSCAFGSTYALHPKKAPRWKFVIARNYKGLYLTVQTLSFCAVWKNEHPTLNTEHPMSKEGTLRWRGYFIKNIEPRMNTKKKQLDADNSNGYNSWVS
jgi:hypothetical protein